MRFLGGRDGLAASLLVAGVVVVVKSSTPQPQQQASASFVLPLQRTTAFVSSAATANAALLHYYSINDKQEEDDESSPPDKRRRFLLEYTTPTCSSSSSSSNVDPSPSPPRRPFNPLRLRLARLDYKSGDWNEEHSATTATDKRRRFLLEYTLQPFVAIFAPILRSQQQKLPPAWAADDVQVMVRTVNDCRFQLQPPPNFEMTTKPLKTHLDEVTWSSTSIPKYQYGITVDPVRIPNIQEFGTPEEVAARVVTAEVNRDGVADVTLVRDAYQDATTGAYVIEYVSQGKRGVKHFVTCSVIVQGKLFVLTVSCQEQDFPTLEKEIGQTIGTFRITGTANTASN